jgi:hypothetical protein
MRNKWVSIPLLLLGFLALALLGGAIVQALWNWLMPPLFGWRTVTTWQGLGLLALCRILFGGFGAHGRHGRGSGKWSHEDREAWRDRMRDRFGDERTSDHPSTV